MHIAHCVFTLSLLIASALYSAQSENKKLNVREPAKYRFLKIYSNTCHADNGETCYKMCVSPDGKYVLSIGSDDKGCYARLHSTQDGKNRELCENHIFTSAKIIHDAVWSRDSAYVVIEDNKKSGAFPIQSPQPQAYVAAAYQDQKCYYTVASSCPTHPGQLTVEFTLDHTCGDSLYADVYHAPEQSCFLNNGTWIALYTPVTRTVMIITNPFKQPAQLVRTLRNVTAADLFSRFPIIGRSDGTVAILNTNTNALKGIRRAFSNTAITAVAIACKRIAALSSEGCIKILSQKTGRTIALYQHKDPHEPGLLRFNPSGEMVVYSAHQSLFTVDAGTAQLLQKIHLDGIPHSLFVDKEQFIVGTSQSITKFARTNQKSKDHQKDA